MTDLSILIPARNEIFLARTISDVLEHSRCDTEVIAVLDGAWSEPPIPLHPLVTVLHHPESIGQRAATNEAARIARGKYVMKLDAHCAAAPGFDEIMLADMQDDITMVPVMRNLHAFNWRCVHCGMEVYQGPEPKQCRNETCSFENQQFETNIVWISKTNPQSSAYRFNKNLRFKYFPELRNKQPKTGLVETMSLQGSCFLMTREKYFELNICDESWGSWGQQGTEVALKTWLSGGRVLCNTNTWYSHLFRTQHGFSHPYPDPTDSQQHAIKICQDIFLNDKWDKAIHPLSWLLDKFWFALKDVKDPEARWTEEDLERLRRIQDGQDTRLAQRVDHNPSTISAGNRVDSIVSRNKNICALKGIVYYTCNTHRPDIEAACRAQLLGAKGDAELVAVSLNKEIEFGDKSLMLEGERGPLMMHRQILAGLQASTADCVFLCESDVLYHPSHFDFTPKRRDVFYYGTNVWRLRFSDGLAVWTDDLQQVSGLCASRELLLDFYTKRLEQIERDGFNRHYEPGIKQTIYGYHKGGKYGVENWKAAQPNICIRHDANLTLSKWSPDEFRDPKYAKGWREAFDIPGWGSTQAILEGIHGMG